MTDLRELRQFHHFDFADVYDAAWIMMLECKMSFFERFVEIHEFVKLIAVDRDFDTRQVALSPNVIANFYLVGKPCIGFDVLFVNVTHPVKRTRANWISVRAIDLCFVAIAKTGFAGRAKVHPRVAAIADLYFCSIAKVFVGAGRVDKH